MSSEHKNMQAHSAAQTDKEKPLIYVGVGASADGLEAIETLSTKLPEHVTKRHIRGER